MSLKVIAYGPLVMGFILTVSNKQQLHLALKLLLISGAALLTAIPQLAQGDFWLNPFLPLFCYGPFLFFLIKQDKRGAFLLGALQGAFMVLIASNWVWSYPDLPKTVVLVAVFVAAFAIGSGTFLACIIRDKVSLPAIAIPFIYALVIVIFEYIRSISPHLFLPLGSVAQSAAYPIFLPLASWFGTGGFSFLVLCVNIAVCLFAFPSVISDTIQTREIKRNRIISGSLLAVLCCALLLGHLLSMQKKIELAYLEEGNTLCAVSDIKRRGRANNGYLDQHQLLQTIQDAEKKLSCNTVVFPEYSAVAVKEAPEEASLSKTPSSAVIAGVMMGDKVIDNSLHVDRFSTNSTCLIGQFFPEIRCAEKTDKQYLAPFAESNLFHKSELLSGFGKSLSKWLGIESNSATTMTAHSSLPLSRDGDYRVGVITCLELFIPDRSRTIVSQDIDVDLIIAPTDLSAFASSKTILSQYKRAAALQAASAKKYLLFTSTEDVTLYSPWGNSIPHKQKSGEIYSWSI